MTTKVKGRMIKTDIWNHPEVQKLTIPAKLLFIYLIVNPHVTAAGCYRVTDKTISDETGISKDIIPECFEELRDKPVELGGKSVHVERQGDFVWLKKFVKHQNSSPLYLKGVVNSLENEVSDRELADKVLEFNKEILSVLDKPSSKEPGKEGRGSKYDG